MQLLRRADSLDMSSPNSPTTTNSSSIYSRFSFPGFRSSSTVSSAASRAQTNTTTEVRGQSNTFSAKLIFGIWEKNCKPGLLFTRSDDTISTTARLTFLPKAQSFKNTLTDEPSKILSDLITVFKLARSNIPNTSRFCSPFSDQNLFRLQELLELAKLWEECAQIDRKYLIGNKIHNLSTVDGCTEAELTRRLLRQPNIYDVLGEAFRMLSCIGLQIPKTSPISSLGTPTTWKNGSTASIRRSTAPLADDATERYKALRLEINQISHTDSITSLPVKDLDKLIDEFSTLHIPLNSIYAQFEDPEDMMFVKDLLEESLVSENQGTPEKKEEMIDSGVAAVKEFSKAAMRLRQDDQDAQLWITAMTNCRRIRSGIVD